MNTHRFAFDKEQAWETIQKLKSELRELEPAKKLKKVILAKRTRMNDKQTNT